MYTQITPEERYRIAEMRRLGFSKRAIAAQLPRAPSTVSREIARNSSRHDGAYRPSKAIERTNGRRSRSRRNTRFSAREWRLVEELLRERWSPEQIAWRLRSEGRLSISHETIYVWIKRDRRGGGGLWRHLRQSSKKRRKGYRNPDSRGRPAGKRHISERPAAVEERREIGHWEIDTIKGDSQAVHSVVTMVERATGYTLMGKIARHCAADATACLIELIESQAGRVLTITSDNGSEFHSFALVEAATGVPFYFATPHHSWERGTNENTNGLIRQYLPKRTSMAHVTQADCEAIARALNTRPRKRLGWKTPEECYGSVR
jgi:IS30 family transposase